MAASRAGGAQDAPTRPDRPQLSPGDSARLEAVHTAWVGGNHAIAPGSSDSITFWTRDVMNRPRLDTVWHVAFRGGVPENAVTALLRGDTVVVLDGPMKGQSLTGYRATGLLSVRTMFISQSYLTDSIAKWMGVPRGPPPLLPVKPRKPPTR
ncbi:MAG: hypothetical protein ACREMU_05540 [Gemmatimonadaceae bacterium]